MRLAPEIVSAIIGVLNIYKSDYIKILLYGSRVDDAKRGGDIDLAWVFPDGYDVFALKVISHRILGALKSHPLIGDRKIDLRILTLSDCLKPFYAEALRDAVDLSCDHK